MASPKVSKLLKSPPVCSSARFRSPGINRRNVPLINDIKNNSVAFVKKSRRSKSTENGHKPSSSGNLCGNNFTNNITNMNCAPSESTHRKYSNDTRFGIEKHLEALNQRWAMMAKNHELLTREEIVANFRLLLTDHIKLEKFLSMVTREHDLTRTRLESDLLDSMMKVEEQNQKMENLRKSNQAQINSKSSLEAVLLMEKNANLINQLNQKEKLLQKKEMKIVDLRDKLELTEFQMIEAQDCNQILEEKLMTSSNISSLNGEMTSSIPAAVALTASMATSGTTGLSGASVASPATTSATARGEGVNATELFLMQSANASLGLTSIYETPASSGLDAEKEKEINDLRIQLSRYEAQMAGEGKSGGVTQIASAASQTELMMKDLNVAERQLKAFDRQKSLTSQNSVSSAAAAAAAPMTDEERQQKEELEEELVETRLELAEIREQLDQQHADNEKLKRELEAGGALIAKQRAELEHAKSQLEKATAEFESIKSSENDKYSTDLAQLGAKEKTLLNQKEDSRRPNPVGASSELAVQLDGGEQNAAAALQDKQRLQLEKQLADKNVELAAMKARVKRLQEENAAAAKRSSSKQLSATAGGAAGDATAGGVAGEGGGPRYYSMKLQDIKQEHETSQLQAMLEAARDRCDKADKTVAGLRNELDRVRAAASVASFSSSSSASKDIKKELDLRSELRISQAEKAELERRCGEQEMRGAALQDKTARLQAVFEDLLRDYADTKTHEAGWKKREKIYDELNAERLRNQGLVRENARLEMRVQQLSIAAPPPASKQLEKGEENETERERERERETEREKETQALKNKILQLEMKLAGHRSPAQSHTHTQPHTHSNLEAENARYKDLVDNMRDKLEEGRAESEAKDAELHHLRMTLTHLQNQLTDQQQHKQKFANKL